MSQKRTRGYSHEFKSKQRRRVAFHADAPPRLKRAATAKAKRERVSLRVLTLRWFTNWTEGRRPDEDPALPEVQS